MEATLRSGNNKYSTAQISTPNITKLYAIGTYTEFSNCFIRIYNPNDTLSRIVVYPLSKNANDIGMAYDSKYVEFISIPKNWIVEVIANSVEITSIL